MPALDLLAIAARFPALARRTPEGLPIVYADAPGGTQCPQDVIDAMASYLRHSNANVGGAFVTSEETGAVVVEARRAMADFLACDPAEVVFGPNMTTLAFQLSRALARELSPRDTVAVTRLDHDANVAPWATAAEDRGAEVVHVDLDPKDCSLDLGSLDRALEREPKLVAFTLASNAVGSITPAHEVARRARDAGAVVIADAVHFAPHHLIDVDELGVDVLFCSPYKFFGPHAGVMWARRDLLERWTPYKVRPAADVVPGRWEGGTKNHEALAGVTAAVDYLASLGQGETRRRRLEDAFREIAVHEEHLSERFLGGIESLRHVHLYGAATASATERTPTFALRVDGRTPREVTALLGRAGVFAWDGNYYALSLMESLGLEESGGAVRIGFCHYHSAEQVDRVLHLLADLEE
jgi:cysteine desulfurase family protein (TIGR01976 family)